MPSRNECDAATILHLYITYLPCCALLVNDSTPFDTRHMRLTSSRTHDQVYQDCGHFFFRVYCPQSCAMSFCTVDDAQVWCEDGSSPRNTWIRYRDVQISPAKCYAGCYGYEVLPEGYMCVILRFPFHT